MNVAAPVIFPALIAGLIWLIAGRLWKRTAAATFVWGGSSAIAVSFCAGHVALMGWPPFPPATAVHTLVFAGLIVGIVGIPESIWRSRLVIRWIIRAVLGGAAAWWQFNTLAEHTWTTPGTIGWLAVVTVTVCAMWEAIDTFAARHPSVTTPFTMWLTACATSVGLVFGASAMLGQLAGCLAAACGAAVVLALWSKTLPLDRGAAGAFAFITTGLLWQGYFYAELPLLSAGLFIVASVATCIIDALVPPNTKPIKHLTIVLSSIILISGAAIAVAFFEYRETAIEVGDYAY